MPFGLRAPVATPVMRRPMHITAGAIVPGMESGVQFPALFPTTPGCPAGHQGKMVMKCCPPMTKIMQDPFSKEWVCVASGFGTEPAKPVPWAMFGFGALAMGGLIVSATARRRLLELGGAAAMGLGIVGLFVIR